MANWTAIGGQGPAKRKGRQMEAMLSFLIEERMRTLQSDGALVRQPRQRARQDGLADASTSPADNRRSRDV
jgi:hypothetical protein